MTLYTVPSTGYAQLIVNAGDGPTMVINRDETNQLYVGTDNSVAAKQGTGDIDIIDPLSYIVYDGVSERYAIAAASQIQVNTVKGATNWAPSPAQAALQISLLGLATASNQSSQLTAANLGNLTTGAIQNITGTITGNHIALQSMVGNPFFTLPGNGNADLSGWNNRFGNFQTAGIQGAVGLPAGSGQPNGVFMTATGATTQLQWGPSGATAFPVVPGQTCNAHFMINAQQTGTAFCGFAFFTSGGIFLSTISPSTPINFANVWQKVFATVQAPATAAFATPVYGISGGIAGNTFYATSCIGYACGQPGTVANDHAQAISTTGAPLIHGVLNIVNVSAVALLANTSQFYPGPSTQLPVPGISYEGIIELFGATNPTSGFVDLSWFENGINVYEERRYLYVGANVAGSHHFLYFKGPSKGSSVTITFNFNANCTLNTFVFNTSSRPTDKDEWRTLSGQFQAGAGLSAFAYDMTKNLIFAGNEVAVAANTTLKFAIPYWEGKYTLHANTGSNTTDLQVIMDDIPSTGDPTSFVNRKSDATGFLEMVDEFLPRSQVVLSLRNGNAAAQTLNCYIIANQY